MSFHHNRGGNRRGGNYNKGGARFEKNYATSETGDKKVLRCFQTYAQELDEKHDRHERIVKCSRDITIESKRIIFLLHSTDAKKSNQPKVCKDAKIRLDKLCDTHFATIAKELHNQDPYQYLRAYKAGLQEFIEAYTFYEFIEAKPISHWSGIQKALCYETDEPETVCLLPPLDFLLGLGDLTGEIMRKCINSIGSGDVDSCFDHCRFLQELYKGFMSIGKSRDFSQKVSTLRESLLKIEKVCYNVKVRGGEAAKWVSTDPMDGPSGHDYLDEGVFF